MKSAKEQHPADETAIDGVHDAVDGVQRAPEGQADELDKVFGSHEEETHHFDAERERERLAAFFGAVASPSADPETHVGEPALDADEPAVSAGRPATGADEPETGGREFDSTAVEDAVAGHDREIERLAALFGSAAVATGDREADAGSGEIFGEATGWQPTFEGAPEPGAPSSDPQPETAWQSWVAEEPAPEWQPWSAEEPAFVVAPEQPRRGVRAALFGSRGRTSVSVATAVVAIAVVAGGGVFGAITINENARLADARGTLATAEASAERADSGLVSANSAYEASVTDAQAFIDEVAPALAAIDGMGDAQTRADAMTALDGVQASIAPRDVATVPEEYEGASLGDADADEVLTVAEDAKKHAARVALAAADFDNARADIGAATSIADAALDALATSLAATAESLVAENPLASAALRDAVMAAVPAVGAARATGGTGAAQLLAYAAAVTALRADQAVEAAKAEEETPVVPRRNTGSTPVTGGGTTPTPAPTPDPAPAPDPSPSDPPPDPTPTDPPTTP